MRARLTLVNGGLFLVAGLALLGVTYLLFDNQLARSSWSAPEPDTAATDGATSVATPAQPVVATSDATASLLTQGAIALVVVGGVAVGCGWLVAGRLLAPLRRVTDTARRIADSGTLRERVALSGSYHEVRELADTFDTMLERLDRAFDGQRHFVANASHELRTPLTLSRALVELAMHRATASPDVRRLGESLLEINARHERLIAGLLMLARAEHEHHDHSPVDLADVVTHVVAGTAHEAARAEVAVHESAAPAPMTGDALLLERLVHNLVENAVRHNTEDGDGWVRVASRTAADGTVEIEVTNTGQTIPPYDVPGLFEPFRRLGGPDQVVSGRSAGLGLSIVRAIADAHAGTVTAEPRAGGGLTVTVSLPHQGSPPATSSPDAAGPPAAASWPA
ncbi:HAMP domain-containing histidine kinase [Streptomyces hainanensis]|uniref:Signal transduction histidine-protein kinase/phosphatase MprB n=2 Tax=Streptomyces hainanensis TaxID=402648 RepID=A0A4R4TRB1_9ACTN|nr:HAMP domain-containing histidine kinase [Streptomyces hainanensis]